MKSRHSDFSEADPAPSPAPSAVIAPVAANIAFVMELTLVPLLLPAMRAQFGLSMGDLAWVFNSYSVAVAIGVFVGGLLGDSFRTTRVFGCGVATFMAGSVLVSAAVSIEALTIGRVLQGFGAGVFSPLVPVLLTRAAPDRPGLMLILWGSLAGYVAAFAPLAYGSIVTEQSWSLAFVFIAAIAAIALLVLCLSPATRTPDANRVERSAYREIFRARDLWLTLAYVFCTYGAITYFLFRLPLWLTENGVATTSIGFVLSILWLTFSGLSALLRNKVDQHHIRTIMLAAPVLIATGLLISYRSDMVSLVAAAVFVGAGLACSNAPSTQLILRHAPKGLSAVSTSLDITFARLGGIMTVAIFAETGAAIAGPALCASCFAAALCTWAICR